MSTIKWKRRTHMGPTAIEEVIPPLGNGMGGYKPPGFWYQVGRSWERLCADSMPDMMCPWLTVVEVDHSRMRVIRSPKELIDFSEEFGTTLEMALGLSKHSPERPKGVGRIRGEAIDWARVQSKWGGIEIAPYLSPCRYNVHWYYGWDVASGVIWDKSAIRVIKAVKKK